jgi:hypothetical protein
MSKLINPWLVDGYVDEQDASSAQGCYVGADVLWEGELAAEKAIRKERERLLKIKSIKDSISRLVDELCEYNPRHRKKRKHIEQQISELEKELQQIKQNNLHG